MACAEMPYHSRGSGNIRVKVSFTTAAVRSAILATAGLLVYICVAFSIFVVDELRDLKFGGKVDYMPTDNKLSPKEAWSLT